MSPLPVLRSVPSGRIEADGPAALLRDLRGHMPALGITRLAAQTGLDRIGIPCYAAIRPNSLTIASHQGKGIDDIGAQLSALMEAAEYAMAEAPETPFRSLSRDQVAAAGLAAMPVDHLLPRDAPWPADRPIRWVEAHEPATGRTVLVPYDAIVLGVPPADLPGLAQSTNGVAAGTSHEAALLHALCELVERDAVCLWGFKPDAAALATVLDPAAFGDPEVARLAARIATAGCRLRLFDLTGNTRLPCIYALISPGDGADRHFDAATGAACHPVAAMAAQRAIVEAAQTRITHIAGARDDIVDAEYHRQLAASLAILTTATPGNRPPPAGLPSETPLAAQLEFVLAGIDRARLDPPVVIALGGRRFGITVLKAFVRGLEDRLTNHNWRPGRRAAAAMLGLL
ncbi:MAG: YcaO-like family protein [Devosia sp.]|nr:YcaO-like family protein [Devosia sp.]